MINDIGFFAINLENNNLHEQICNLINNYIDNRKQNQIVLFNQYNEKIDTKNIPILSLNQSKYFDGDIVVFDLQSLIIATGAIKCNNIYYYTHGIPWQVSYNSYYIWKSIFGNTKLKIIAGNQNIYNVYNLLWNNSIGICEVIEYEQFSRFV